MRVILFLALLILTLCVPTASAQQGPYTVQAANSTAWGVPLEWREYARQPGMWYLHQGEARLGAWWAPTCQYWPLHQATSQWGPECRPPVPLPRVQPADIPAALNFGVVSKRVGTHGPRYLIDGKTVGRATAYQAVETGELADDSGKLRVTAFGSPEKTKAVADAIAALPQSTTVLFQTYQPTDPMVRSLGFRVDADPTVYVQTPKGKVLHRGAYAGPAQLAQAIRRADSSYDPSRDPDLTRPAGPLAGLDLASVPQWAWGAGGVAVLFLALKLWSNRKARLA